MRSAMYVYALPMGVEAIEAYCISFSFVPLFPSIIDGLISSCPTTA